MMPCNIESFITIIIIIVQQDDDDDDCCTSTTNAGNALHYNVLFMDIYVYDRLYNHICGIYMESGMSFLCLFLLRQK